MVFNVCDCVEARWYLTLSPLLLGERRNTRNGEKAMACSTEYKLVWENRNNKKAIVLSIGQVVPHEVMGMANFNKNMFIGVGGLEAIDLSHFIGAVYGMENMMGKADNPLRSILNYASEHFLGELDLWYILTVVGSNPTTGNLEMKGLFIGNDIECYTKACELSLKVNFTILEKKPSKMVVYLDEDEFHSTWLGNKAICRTIMAIADEGELIVWAPGIKRFGEDDGVDELIRQSGKARKNKHTYPKIGFARQNQLDAAFENGFSKVSESQFAQDFLTNGYTGRDGYVPSNENPSVNPFADQIYHITVVDQSKQVLFVASSRSHNDIPIQWIRQLQSPSERHNECRHGRLHHLEVTDSNIA